MTEYFSTLPGNLNAPHICKVKRTYGLTSQEVLNLFTLVMRAYPFFITTTAVRKTNEIWTFFSQHSTDNKLYPEYKKNYVSLDSKTREAIKQILFMHELFSVISKQVSMLL